MLRDDFGALARTEAVSDDQQLTIGLVFAEPKSPDAVARRIGAELPGLEFHLEPVFDEGRDRFHFVDFAEIRPDGQEAQVFQAARSLRVAVEAEEANPLLTDSIYGAMAVGAATAETFPFSCVTPRTKISPFGLVHPIVQTPQAWAQTCGAGATVAVIDTGHSSHRKLAGAIVSIGQANFVEGGTNAADLFVPGFLKHPRHGTLVCSVLASRSECDAEGNTSGHRRSPARPPKPRFCRSGQSAR